MAYIDDEEWANIAAAEERHRRIQQKINQKKEAARQQADEYGDKYSYSVPKAKNDEPDEYEDMYSYSVSTNPKEKAAAKADRPREKKGRSVQKKSHAFLFAFVMTVLIGAIAIALLHILVQLGIVTLF